MSYVQTHRGLGAAPVEPVAPVGFDLRNKLPLIAAVLSIAASLLHLRGRR